jgi:hypothetical protein
MAHVTLRADCHEAPIDAGGNAGAGIGRELGDRAKGQPGLFGGCDYGQGDGMLGAVFDGSNQRQNLVVFEIVIEDEVG